MYELQQKIVRAKIDKEQEELQAETRKEVARLKAEEDSTV
jgi:regulator of protease activity HflC (stomatin/prohibitin superfamily)